MEIATFYFPNYHRDPHNESWYGTDWTEWELVKSAVPRFEGHHQPLVPQWGYYDEADPSWAAKEIDLASDHGIDVFIYDWYWYSGVRYLHQQLENGFLQAPNRNRMKFALMWANHTLRQIFPASPRKSIGDMHPWLPIHHSNDDLDRVMDYCIEHYFQQPNYWTVEGRLYFSFFSYHTLLQGLNRSASEVRRALERMDDRVRRAGLPGLHFGINIANVDVGTLAWNPNMVNEVKKAGFHSVFGYNITRSQQHEKVPIDRPLVKYEDIMATHEYLWAQCDGLELPFFPVVTTGGDASPRWDPSVKFPLNFRGYPYEPIVIDKTPARFAQLCERVVEFIQKSHSEPKVIMINAWNEWTEGNYLLPEKKYGTKYLEAVKAMTQRKRYGSDLSLRRTQTLNSDV